MIAENIPTTKKIRGTVYIHRERCKGCGFCIEFCPPKVLEFEAGYNSKGYHTPLLANSDLCTGCDLCGLYCPDFAIYGVRIKKV
jgi:2-oxoglutarate ferredoxin oxidoreductase subunit delta